jgi:predicted amino acid-binding ACT domain protein
MSKETNTSHPHRYALSVLVADRVGIMRDITAALMELNADIDGISQTVVASYFTIIATISTSTKMDTEVIRSAIESKFHPDEASVVVRPFRAPGNPQRQGRRKPYVVTMIGENQSGLLAAVTAFLCEKKINIEDWYVQFAGSMVTHIGEITVPDKLDIRQVQDELEQALASFGLQSRIQHQNIFRATNEIGPIRALLAETSHD